MLRVGVNDICCSKHFSEITSGAMELVSTCKMLIIEIIASDFITCGVDHNVKLKALNKFSEEICKSDNICNR